MALLRRLTPESLATPVALIRAAPCAEITNSRISIDSPVAACHFGQAAEEVRWQIGYATLVSARYKSVRFRPWPQLSDPPGVGEGSFSFMVLLPLFRRFARLRWSKRAKLDKRNQFRP